MASAVELAAMRQAITLSSLGLGTTSPNPPVGCVILDRHGTVVGAGFHRRKGEAHAEVHALAAAGTAARGGTAVVTLEPCNHVGVTPACRQELIDAGIARVVISVIDPTSRGDGGAAMLAAAGIEVETDVLHDEALAVLGPWLTATLRRRPHLTWAYASNSDGDQGLDEQLLVDLRYRADLVVANEIDEEGLLGGHAAEHFSLPGQADADTGLLHWLTATYAAGTRSVLLVGSGHAEALHGDLTIVDEIVVAMRRTDPPRALAAVPPHVVPAGFRLVDVSARSGFLASRFRQPVRGQA
ncbi:bifunctional diaminohydroxyphosphoribosylaminopyrimidine deaminase/5-amino-6-(5-phosphoribosylamino)uracil reductase RibD [Micromonospora sp. CB01531]|uniref:bifunctional diaminohydroxyphosphoribosylaminopyrimidine deaminase/5-amino-6-(5-phosphoribosylamino)uracil reductase RibD n=1 Tax=Micromonospora sp. CB01531 TaxID=1718947 RepID=UPI00093BA18E|nr:bifunctional diaminohydroxyphosphoribosylaminopyrimidine deaminase/5-amino-6-(5-phosphoribosylamino)uracil reductase RibD [Micromonospora sp. CB01531]